ncbi:MAG: DUF3987 domain-containing protein, partial [Alphaproteobacteria bacterium]|nr:DUF3987 domain-containing protein [Alphaproteobacteria bacterium]
DIDNCLQSDGQWTPEALAICELFAGVAAVEVSQSERGMHLFGYASVILAHRNKNIPLGIELYTHNRFVALTDKNTIGQIGPDASEQLATFIEKYGLGAQERSTSPQNASGGQSVDMLHQWPYNGPGVHPDDGELIRIALKSGKRTASAYFNEAHVCFESLWTADADALARRYPSQNGYDAYDASSADIALASHLAYWTRKNAARIERLMRQSALARTKWDDRPDYLPRTIDNACKSLTSMTDEYVVPSATLLTDWPAPLPIVPSLLPVPAFEPSLLPSALRPWCIDIAARMSVPLDMVAIPALVQAGALIGRRIGIRPEARTDWLEVGNLWGVIVAPPGALKSPVMTDVLKPIKRLEVKAADGNKLAKAEHEARVAISKIAEKEAKAAMKDGDTEHAMQIMLQNAVPERPPEKRYIINDCTVEKLGELCADNPDGLLIYRDEVMSLFGELEQSEKISQRGFFLSGWGGQEAYTFDRIGRGTTRIPAVNLSLIGTTQPDRLKRFISENLASLNDGMVQRLQLLSWPDMLPNWTPCDRQVDAVARENAWKCFEALTNMKPDVVGAERDPFDDGSGIPFLRFTPDAQQMWNDFRCELESKLRDEDLPPALASHFAKYRGLVPRLALIMHFASEGFGLVTRVALSRAIELSAYL